MGQLWCTGACSIYIGPSNVSSNAQSLFLGFAEEAPDIEIAEESEPVITDPGGNKVPTDDSWQGEQGTATMVLTYWNQPAFMAITCQPRVNDSFTGGGISAPIRGTSIPGDIGTLLMTEGQAPLLYVVFPYAVKPSFGGGVGPPAGMELGYRFCNAKLRNYDLGAKGTKDRKIALSFELRRRMVIGTNSFYPTAAANAYGSFSFVLYDGFITGLPVAA